MEQGLIKDIGLSGCGHLFFVTQRQSKCAGEKLIAVQVEYTPFELVIEECGLLASAKELGVSVVTYSPLGRGLITGRYVPLLLIDIESATHL